MPAGNLFGAIFFLCLTVAGLSSAISIMEAFVAAVVDKFGVNRGPLVTIISILGFIGGIVFTTDAGLLWLDIVDHFITHFGLIVVGILECIVVGWLFNLSALREHINQVSTIKLGIWWELLIKFFIPFILGLICLGDLYTEIQKPYGNYNWASLILIGRDWLLATLAVAFIFAARPWKTDHLQAQGRNDKRAE